MVRHGSVRSCRRGAGASLCSLRPPPAGAAGAGPMVRPSAGCRPARGPAPRVCLRARLLRLRGHVDLQQPVDLWRCALAGRDPGDPAVRARPRAVSRPAGLGPDAVSGSRATAGVAAGRRGRIRHPGAVARLAVFGVSLAPGGTRASGQPGARLAAGRWRGRGHPAGRFACGRAGAGRCPPLRRRCVAVGGAAGRIGGGAALALGGAGRPESQRRRRPGEHRAGPQVGGGRGSGTRCRAIPG
jgi:hypothetical protein